MKNIHISLVRICQEPYLNGREVGMLSLYGGQLGAFHDFFLDGSIYLWNYI